jgi:hypothetical protein
MNREAIYGALFALLSRAAPFATAARRLRHWSDVAAAEQPALFLVQKRETAQRRSGQPTRWTLLVDLYVYARAADELSPPAAVLNPLLDAIDAALGPDNAASNRQTLGGLIEHAAIGGAIETDEGALGGQAVAIVPVEVVVTA